MDPILEKGLMLVAYGLGGVFFALIVFYIMIRLLVVLFPKKEENSRNF